MILIAFFFSMDDPTTIEALKEGDESAFRDIVAMYQDRVYNTSPGFLETRQDTEDVAQEIFIEGLSYEEIAAIMDASLPAIESLMHRAKTQLRKKLSDYYPSLRRLFLSFERRRNCPDEKDGV